MKNALSMNDHLVGIALKELVRRAIIIARREALNFEVYGKVGYDGLANDVFTNTDKLVQESYLGPIKECFPGVGVVGEEDSLVIPSCTKKDAYFTIDPIDGTRAYIRRQSHGIGSMVALVVDGSIKSVYIGDINSQEIFGYRPGSSSVWRITSFETCEKLNANPACLNMDQLFILLRERENTYCELSQKTINIFKSIAIDCGSIGIWAARLWKNEVGALLLNPAWETPWDSSPVIGISQKLGYQFLRPVDDGWRRYNPTISKVPYWREHDLLIIHKNQLPMLEMSIKVL